MSKYLNRLKTLEQKMPWCLLPELWELMTGGWYKRGDTILSKAEFDERVRDRQAPGIIIDDLPAERD